MTEKTPTPDPGSFTGAGTLLFDRNRLVIEVRKPHKWERPPGKPLEIGIGSVGGSIEPGETILEAFHREANEEIGCPVEAVSSSITLLVTPDGVRELPDYAIEDIRPAIVWEVGDPTFVVGSYVAVFRSRVLGDPQPGDLPAILLSHPELLPRIDTESMTVAQAVKAGAEVRSRIDIPSDGTLILCNTLRHLMTIRDANQTAYETLVKPFH